MSQALVVWARTDGPGAVDLAAAAQPEDIARANQQKQAPDRQARLVAYGLMRRVLAKQGLTQARVSRDTGGAPFLPDHPGYNLSLSHCRAAVAVGFAPGARIGVDVEQAQAPEHWHQIARYFAPQLREQAVPGDLHQVWVMVEAHAKALRCGLPQLLETPPDFLPGLVNRANGCQIHAQLLHGGELALGYSVCDGVAVTVSGVLP